MGASKKDGALEPPYELSKIIGNRLVDPLEKCQIVSLVLDLLDQLQIFLQFYLIELLGLLIGLVLLQVYHLIYPRLSTGLGMLIVLTNISLMDF